MKLKDIKALHDQTIDQLLKQLAELQRQLAQARIKKQANKLENVASVKLLADDVARIKTILQEKNSQESVKKSIKISKESKSVKKVTKEKK